MDIQTEHLPAGLYKCIWIFCNINFCSEGNEFWRSWISSHMENYAGSFCNGFGCMLMIHIRDLARKQNL